MVRDIEYEDTYVNEEYGTTTLYFIGPEERLKDFLPKENYPEAIGMCISVEVPSNNIESSAASVMVSPTKKIDGGYSDYDWHDVELDYDVINTLFMLADV